MILPPYAAVLRLAVERDEAGAPVLTMPFEPDVLGRPGFLHGGAIGGLLEMAAFAALQHALGEADARIKPINVTVDYMRGGRERLTYAKGIVTRLGSRVANVSTTAWQDAPDQPIAAARTNYLIVRG
jgi:uncharacterized protein (TIGR00369 family)